MKAAYLCVLLVMLSAGSYAAGAAYEPEPIPRTILALYDSRVSEQPFYTAAHQMAEMPLNHLGCRVRYADVSKPLPAPDSLSDIRGVLMWMESGEMQDPEGFLRWAEEVAARGKAFVLIGDLAFMADSRGEPTSGFLVNRFLKSIGLRCLFDWTPITYDVSLEILDPRVVGYERKFDGVIPPFEKIRAIDPDSRVFLRILAAAGRKDYGGKGLRQTAADLVVVTPNGGYVASGYTHFSDPENDRKSWILNPFEFFRQAFRTDDLPKADTTTLSGNRIYYSHIDGDGWRNISMVPKYARRPTISAEVILKEVLEPFTDLPVTVGPVAADLHPDWLGRELDREVARRIFALPHVELGNHTFSHPFDWGFFEDGDPDKEIPYLDRYEHSWKQSLAPSWIAYWSDLFGLDRKVIASDHREGAYETPRAFALEPFSLEMEILGASAFIESLAPPGKKVRIIQWSGNTRPFEEAIRTARLAGLANINGGDTRFDRDFASVAWVAPVGRQVGSEIQIYASNSNENTYTDLWSDRYFGFVHLIRTFENTETPIRLKPINVYYHMYSGEKLSSLNAVLANLRYIRTHKLCPVPTSRFAMIGTGFFTAEFARLGPDRWLVRNHGQLQTVRFDGSTFKQVDFPRSRGVIGQKHFQGSLYVALDRSETEPVIALKAHAAPHLLPDASRPYLVEGRWDVWNLEIETGGRFRFQTAGYGPGILLWKVPRPGTYTVTTTDEKGEVQPAVFSSGDSGVLTIEIGYGSGRALEVEVREGGNSS